MYRIVVETGADFSANVGDEAYFAAMVDLFRARFGDRIEITKFANEPETIAQRYGIKSLYSGRSPRRRLKALWPTLKAIARADVYVWGGGQMPLDSHGVLSVLYRFHRPMLAKLMGTPVMSYAVGAGPIDMPHSRVLVRHCMSAYDLVTVRDHFSVSLLEEVGVRKPIHETVDSAIVLEAAPRERVAAILRAEGVPLDRPLVGMVPWGPAFRRLKSVVPVIFRKRHFTAENVRRIEAHCAILAGAFDAFIERHGVFVVFVAMDRSKGHGFDDEVARRTISKMKHADQVRLLEGAYHPKEVKGILGRCEVVAGSRMHGLILATGETVPTAGICFTEKILDFARITGQADSYISVAEMHTSADLAAVLDRCWADREASKRSIERVLVEFRAKVRQNVERLARLLIRARRRRGPGVAARVRDINTVRRYNLCHFCGTCYGVCPRDNIRIGREWNDKPHFVAVDLSRCAGCGLCWRVCPGREIDFKAHRRTLFDSEPTDERIGCFERLLVTQSTRPAVRERATSGGTVSELARFLLESHVVDGVVVTRMDCSGDRPRPVTWIATDVSELDRLQGSLYMMAPVNTVLRTIRRAERGKRFALVGLGCHVEGLRAAQRELPWLRERVPLVIGLFCGHGVNPAGTWHLIRRLGFTPDRITSLAYRLGPGPGRFHVATRDGRMRELPMAEYSYMLACYGNARCSMCIDPLCELADVSVGDAWLPELRGRGGWNLTVVRTPAGARLVERLIRTGRLRAEPTTADRLNQAQRMQLYKRERKAWAWMALLRRAGRKVPIYRGVSHAPLRRADLKRALTVILMHWLAQARMTQMLMVPLCHIGRWLLGRRARAKDALIGRDPAFREQFFVGDEYQF